jgi:hypothetical protein
MYVYMYVCVRIYVCMCVCVCMYVCLYVCMYVCIGICMYVCMQAHVKRLVVTRSSVSNDNQPCHSAQVEQLGLTWNTRLLCACMSFCNQPTCRLPSSATLPDNARHQHAPSATQTAVVVKHAPLKLSGELPITLNTERILTSQRDHLANSRHGLERVCERTSRGGRGALVM